MHNNIKQLLKTIIIISFIVVLTIISFEKERRSKAASEINKEYSDERLNAEIVSNTAPETVNHTELYKIEITVRNGGTATWTNSGNIRLCIWQDEFDYGFRVNIPDGIEVHSGEQWTFELDGFGLPEASQTKLEFQMVEEGVTYFGEREAVVITAAD